MEIAKFLPLVLEASAQASAGIVLLLGVRMVSSRFVAGRWLYLLWMVVMARLLLPGSLLPEAPMHLPHAPTVRFPAHYFSMDNTMEPVAKATITDAPREPVAAPVPSPAPRRAINWWNVAGVVWLGGALGLAAYLVGAAWWLRRRILREERTTPREIAGIWDGLTTRGRKPTLVTSAAVKAPVLVGLRRLRLVLPAKGLEYLSAEDWEHIFLHELAHARRRDCWTNLLPLAALCVHWFNPLVWWCQRAIRADRESATDELVLRGLGEERSEQYAATLLRVLSGGGFSGALPGAIGIAESGAGLKRRFRRIVGYRPARLAATFLGVALVGVVAMLSFAQEKKAEEKSEPMGAIRTAKDVQTRLLDAGRKQDTDALLEVLRIDNEIIWPRYDDARTALEEAARLDDQKAFVFLLNNLRRTGLLHRLDGNKTRAWEPNEELLTNAIAKQQKDILTTLLAYGLDTKALAEAEKKTPPQGAFVTWLSDAVKAAEQKRAAANRLIKAAREGDIAAAQKEINEGTDINGAGDAGWTPLIEAVRSKKLEMAKFLLKNGANPNTPRLSIGEAEPLSYAQSAEMAQALKDAGGDINAKDFVSGMPLFMGIVRSRPTEVTKWFIDQGVDPKIRGTGRNEPTALFYVRNPETIKLLIDKGVPVNALNRRGETVLFEAVRGSQKSLDVVKTLLENGADPNIRNKYGNVAIMNAPNAAAVELLIAHGADLTVKNDDGESVLQFTGYEEDPSRREALARHGVKMDPKTEGIELLKRTILSHDLAKAKDLLAAGVDPDAEGISFQQYRDASSMSLATGFAHFDIVNAMREAGGKDVGVLSQAAAEGNLAKVRELLANGASVNETTSMGQTPLSFALRRGQLEVMRELLKAGADPNAISGWGLTDHIYAKFMEIQWKFNYGENPLQFDKTREEEASFYPKAIALMTEYAKPEPNRKTADGETALTIASARGNNLSLYALKEMGGDINYQRPDGMTAMMLAIVTKPAKAREGMSRRLGEDGRIIENTVAGSMVYNLLELKADTTLRNRDGKTALDLARERNDREIIDMLENYTAKQQAAK